MLELRKKGLFSKEYVVQEKGTVVAELSRSRWRDQAEVTVQGKILKLRRQGLLRDAFALCDGDIPIVEVSEPSMWQSRLVFRFDKTEYEMVSKAWYSSTLLVKSGGSVVGSVQPRGLLAAGAYAHLPDSLPLAVRVFIGWVATVRWDQAAAAAS